MASGAGDVELSQTNGNGSQEANPKPKSSRRPDIDIIRIGLTWGILLYHTVLIYTPYLSYYVRIIPLEIPNWHLIGLWFVITMNAWNMPMFFFLSGISAFFGLKKRSESQFRNERVHRLMIPAIFLSLTASFCISADWAAILSPNCQEYYDTGNVVSKNDTDAIVWDHCAMFFKFTSNTTYWEHLRNMFQPVPSPHQGWFLCYLFVYSQLLVHLFISVHPNHQEDNLSCIKRPFSKPVQFFTCLNFFGYLTPNNESFIKAVNFWLGHPLKLFFVPSIWIGIVEVSLRWIFPDGNLWFFGWATDICNDIKFIFIFVIGFGITAADELGMKEVIRKGRWFNFIIGTIVLIVYGGNFLVGPYIWLFYFLRGFAEWLFIIGTYGVCREVFTTTYSWIPVFSEIAMPFYLTHQQVLIPIAAASSWVPYLRSLPIVLILATLGTLLVSWLITKAGPIRYFFGLSTSPDSLIPGKKMNGFLPLTILNTLFIAGILMANFL